MIAEGERERVADIHQQLAAALPTEQFGDAERLQRGALRPARLGRQPGARARPEAIEELGRGPQARMGLVDWADAGPSPVNLTLRFEPVSALPKLHCEGACVGPTRG